jgi:hypothetical protein
MSTNKLASAEMAAFAAAFLCLLLVIAALSGPDFFPSNRRLLSSSNSRPLHTSQFGVPLRYLGA